MKIHKICFIRTKSPQKYRIGRIHTVLNLRVAFWTRNVLKCQRMSAYEQHTLSMTTVIMLNTLLNRPYVIDTPDIL